MSKKNRLTEKEYNNLSGDYTDSPNPYAWEIERICSYCGVKIDKEVKICPYCSNKKIEKGVD